MRTTVAAAVSTALWLAAPAAWGQSGQHWDGLRIDAGLGYGTMNRSCDRCYIGPRTGGSTGFLQVERAVSPHVRVGGALHIWWHSGSDDYTSAAVASERLSNLGAMLHYYPFRGGLFLGGGLGVSNYHSTSADAYSNAWGWGFTTDAGYNLRLTYPLSLTSRLVYSYGAIGTVTEGALGGSFTGWKQNVIDFVVGLTVR